VKHSLNHSFIYLNFYCEPVPYW